MSVWFGGLALNFLFIPFIFWYLKKQDVGGTIKHAPFIVKFFCLSTIFISWFSVLTWFSLFLHWLEFNNWYDWDGWQGDGWFLSLWMVLPLLIFILISKIDIIINKKTTKYTINDKDQSVKDVAKYLLFVIERPLLIGLSVFYGIIGAGIIFVLSFAILFPDGNYEHKYQIARLSQIAALFVFWKGLTPANESETESPQEKPQSELLKRVKLKVAEKLHPQSEFLIDVIHWCCLLSIIWTPLFALPALFCSSMTFRHSHPKRIPTLIVCLICIVFSLLIAWAGLHPPLLAPGS